jgi:hypothetical protein
MGVSPPVMIFIVDESATAALHAATWYHHESQANRHVRFWSGGGLGDLSPTIT